MNRAEILKSTWFRGIVRLAYLKGQVDAYKNNIDGVLGDPSKEAYDYVDFVVARESEALRNDPVCHG